ncbi:hypothetical protein EI427_06790 [Flammeovirga pectinis]|uniref:Lipoprotein n=1 Tax=Flammeovirga pectinis TaxID=2494373 RepID=A0A3S9P182_9BACT|nr:hypothetical protein [Flammeovirga pectinis]AZQ61954.1 hypothetical protein EI427_06790 [Flammeovirga pectinis]
MTKSYHLILFSFLLFFSCIKQGKTSSISTEVLRKNASSFLKGDDIKIESSSDLNFYLCTTFKEMSTNNPVQKVEYILLDNNGKPTSIKGKLNNSKITFKDDKHLIITQFMGVATNTSNVRKKEIDIYSILEPVQ